MVTEITSKSELLALATKLETEVQMLKDTIVSMHATLSSVTNYDGIDAASAGNTLSQNLSSIAADAEIAAANIKNYANGINNLDVNDLTGEEEEATDEIETETTISTGTTETTETESESTTENTSTSSGGSTLSGMIGTGITTGISNVISSAGTFISNTINNATSTGSSSSTNSSSTTSTSSSSSNNGSVSTTTGTVTSSGKTSATGRTQRSALTDIVITNGDKNIDISRYSNNLANGFEVTTGNLAYELCDDDVELLCAIVSAESDKTYDDALAVISTILNRCERTNWIASHGRDPIAQATAPNQFVVYQQGNYEKYMDGNAPETVVQAVKDALAGVRNHSYCSFRSNGSTSYSNNMITATGNRYK